MELVHRGKMHGFMRMYWAKKVLEWTASPEEALSIAIRLNDKYSLDGSCPNGFVGCAWSIGGVHDQGWKERPVFGKIRYSTSHASCAPAPACAHWYSHRFRCAPPTDGTVPLRVVNFAGCKRKFDVAAYVRRMARLL